MGEVKKKRGAPYGNQNALGNKGGAPRGNKNAVGNKGGGAPYCNLNAEIHGLYSYTYWRNKFLAVKVYNALLELDREEEFNNVFADVLKKQYKHNSNEGWAKVMTKDRL